MSFNCRWAATTFSSTFSSTTAAIELKIDDFKPEYLGKLEC